MACRPQKCLPLSFSAVSSAGYYPLYSYPTASACLCHKLFTLVAPHPIPFFRHFPAPLPPHTHQNSFHVTRIMFSTALDVHQLTVLEKRARGMGRTSEPACSAGLGPSCLPYVKRTVAQKEYGWGERVLLFRAFTS